MAVTEVRQQAAGGAAKPGVRSEPVPLSGAETERVRRRVRLVVQIASRLGKYRPGLALATRRLTPSEAAILADLEQHGLDVPQIREVLCGAHVLVDDPDLYQRWRFPKSRERLSSHHVKVDKKLYPDIGFKGPLVREKLHGRTAAGTWLQLEKTPALDGARLSPADVDRPQAPLGLHRVPVHEEQRGPVGAVEEHRAAADVPLSQSAGDGASPGVGRGRVDRRPGTDRGRRRCDVRLAGPRRAVSAAGPRRHARRARLHPGLPQRPRAVRQLGGLCIGVALGGRARGAGLAHDPPRWTLPHARRTRPATIRAGDREIRWAARRVPLEEQEERT